jgi:SAM-dependent methyltransferase
MAERARDPAEEVAEAERIRAYFDRDAERFDRIYAGANRSPVQRLVDRLFRSAMLRRRAEAICGFVFEGETCLEIGSGSGRIAVPLALQRKAQVIGIDLAPAMVERAEALARDTGADRFCRFYQGDFMAFVPDRPVDVVVAAGVVDYLADPRPLLTRAAGMARRAIVVTYPHKHRLLNVARWLWLYGIKRCPVYFYSDADIEKLAAAIGGRVGARHKSGRWPLVEETVARIDLPAR